MVVSKTHYAQSKVMRIPLVHGVLLLPALLTTHCLYDLAFFSDKRKLAYKMSLCHM